MDNNNVDDKVLFDIRTHNNNGVFIMKSNKVITYDNILIRSLSVNVMKKLLDYFNDIHNDCNQHIIYENPYYSYNHEQIEYYGYKNEIKIHIGSKGKMVYCHNNIKESLASSYIIRLLDLCIKEADKQLCAYCSIKNANKIDINLIIMICNHDCYNNYITYGKRPVFII